MALCQICSFVVKESSLDLSYISHYSIYNLENHPLARWNFAMELTSELPFFFGDHMSSSFT